LGVSFPKQKIQLMKTIFFLFFLICTLYGDNGKVLICGVCKDVASATPNTIKQIEELGSQFKEWRAIIYENNSRDQTKELYLRWAKQNARVIFISENLTAEKMAPSRSEKIANARNRILEEAKYFRDYDFLIMVDLDFKTPWPIKEILTSCHLRGDWDCICANGMKGNDHYYDRYALRNKEYPFGPELLGDVWWMEARGIPIHFKGEELVPLFSGFGGLAIYKMKSIEGSFYSGLVTEDLTHYYRQIISQVAEKNHHLQIYLREHHLLKGGKVLYPFGEIPIYFKLNTFPDRPINYDKVTCCEHVPFFASMALKGHGKIYLNPKLVMKYE
jgi:hypothetical protein